MDGSLQHLNDQDEDIEFTTEKEEDKQLPFLDTVVQQEESSHLQTSVYRKPASTDKVLSFNSHHLVSAKRPGQK